MLKYEPLKSALAFPPPPDSRVGLISLCFLLLSQTLKIHDDSVRSMCVLARGFVATGPGSRDGKIAIWRIDEETSEDLDFVRLEFGIVRSVSQKVTKLDFEEGPKKDNGNLKTKCSTY